VKGSNIGKVTGLPLTRQARIKVDNTLQVPGHPVVFVVGDLAGAQDREGLFPMLIPVAMQEGRHVAATISDMVRGGGARAFRYKDPGIMATIGATRPWQRGPDLFIVDLAGFCGSECTRQRHQLQPPAVLVNWPGVPSTTGRA
jgi:NADH dehydrogenase FAD-containing subunit